MDITANWELHFLFSEDLQGVGEASDASIEILWPLCSSNGIPLI